MLEGISSVNLSWHIRNSVPKNLLQEVLITIVCHIFFRGVGVLGLTRTQTVQSINAVLNHHAYCDAFNESSSIMLGTQLRLCGNTISDLSRKKWIIFKLSSSAPESPHSHHISLSLSMPSDINNLLKSQSFLCVIDFTSVNPLRVKCFLSYRHKQFESCV